MRPIRFLLLLASFIILPIFLTCLSLIHREKASREPLGPEVRSKGGRLRALFSFTAPSSLFPPSALISLTNDNSTFFLARPAAFGPSLPSHGLSARLWVGKGFGKEILLTKEDISRNGYELGCSDVPGWDEEHKQRVENGAVKAKSSEQVSARLPRSHIQSKPSLTGANDDKYLDVETDTRLEDGTDDHLHHPLPDSNPAVYSELGEPANAAIYAGKIPTHADIESLQESADIAGKIVMLSRGGCGFLEKVKWAQRRGGIAVVVGDNQPGGQLTIMYAKGDTSNVTIPSIFTSHNAAHLLSSLVPPEKNNGDTSEESSRVGSYMGKSTDQRTSKSTGLRSTSSSKAQHPQASKLQEAKQGWMQNVLSVVGLEDDKPGVDNSRRPPTSGNIDWVLLEEDWDDDQPEAATVVSSAKNPATTKATVPSIKNIKPMTTSTKRGGDDDFVIGIQDWRDTDLIAPKATESVASAKGKREKVGRTVRSLSKGKTNVNLLPKRDFITPSSGEYDHQPKRGIKVENRKVSPKLSHSEDDVLVVDQQSLSEKVRSFLYGSDSRDIVHPGPQDRSHPSNPNLGTNNGDKDKHDKEEGLWVTLTPTSVSDSPFFDTLLVLVVSPLVTLTVVYGLLLLRSRIRRRRWRAPKSIVEQLPVRTYHTMATSSSTTSSVVQSAVPSTVTSPQLRPSSARSRPRSQTTTGVITPNFEKLASKKRRGQAKRYTGRQIECVVCLEEYVDGESKVMSLPCGHEFHAECITPWLVTRRRTCPICKGDVVRSFSRSDHAASGSNTSADEDQVQEGGQTSDDVQERAVATVNDDASAAIPIPTRDSADVEQGDDQSTPLLTANRRANTSWRGVLGASISRLSGDTLWRSTPSDRAR